MFTGGRNGLFHVDNDTCDPVNGSCSRQHGWLNCAGSVVLMDIKVLLNLLTKITEDMCVLWQGFVSAVCVFQLEACLVLNCLDSCFP